MSPFPYLLILAIAPTALPQKAKPAPTHLILRVQPLASLPQGWTAVLTVTPSYRLLDKSAAPKTGSVDDPKPSLIVPSRGPIRLEFPTRHEVVKDIHFPGMPRVTPKGMVAFVQYDISCEFYFNNKLSQEWAPTYTSPYDPAAGSPLVKCMSLSFQPRVPNPLWTIKVDDCASF